MERVRESVEFSGGRVDRSGPYPRVLDVAICGLSSVHGYEYDRRCWENGRAKAMYEGLNSYVGHGDGDRTGEKLGWWENVRTRPDGRPCGDYCLNPKHPLAESVLWAAEHKPDFYTVSHVADVKKARRPDGRVVVESMAGRAHSIDLVDVGGTQGSLRESGHQRRPGVVTVKEYANKLGRKCTVEQLLKLRALVKEDGMGDLPMPADAPPPDAEGTSEDDGISAAFMAAITGELKACMDAKGDPAKLKKCLCKVKKLLMAHGEIKADDGDADTSTDAATDADPAKESGRGKRPAAVDPWELLTECEREQYKPDATDLKVLKLVSESGDRLAYIRRQKQLTNATQPSSASRQQLAGTGTDTAKESGGGAEPASGVEEVRQIMARLSKDARGAS